MVSQQANLCFSYVVPCLGLLLKFCIISGSSFPTLCSGAHQHFQQVIHLPWCRLSLSQWSRYLLSFLKVSLNCYQNWWYILLNPRNQLIEIALLISPLLCGSRYPISLVAFYNLYIWLQSTGAYKAASRLAIATPPPAYVLSRGIGWQVSSELFWHICDSLL